MSPARPARKEGIVKKILIGVAAVVVIIVVTLLIVGKLTSGMTSTADSFFAAVAAGDRAAAAACLSEDFKASTSMDALWGFLEQSALVDYESASWGSREISGGQGQLEGSISTEGGGSVPVTIHFVKEADQWSIQRIEKAGAGISQAPETLSIPEDAALAKMVSGSMGALARAINAADFGPFHAGVSELRKSQISAGELQSAFQAFIDQGIDLTALDGMEPVLSERPALDPETNVLGLKGYFASSPSVTNFEFDYIYEHPNWKLLGVNVYFTQAEE